VRSCYPAVQSLSRKLLLVRTRALDKIRRPQYLHVMAYDNATFVEALKLLAICQVLLYEGPVEALFRARSDVLARRLWQPEVVSPTTGIRVHGNHHVMARIANFRWRGPRLHDPCAAQHSQLQ
jgi:hypothetical protein